MERGEVNSEILSVGTGDHLLQQLIQVILLLQNGLPQNGRLKKMGIKISTSKKPRIIHKATSGKTPSKFATLKPSETQWLQICYLVHAISKVWSSKTAVSSFPNKKWVILSHFSLIQNECKDFELVLLKVICQRNHVLNYTSGSGLDTK